jgi:hypothetical protein
MKWGPYGGISVSQTHLVVQMMMISYFQEEVIAKMQKYTYNV